MPGQYAGSHAAYQAFPSYPAQSYTYQPYQQHPQQKPPNAHTNQVATLARHPTIMLRLKYDPGSIPGDVHSVGEQFPTGWILHRSSVPRAIILGGFG